MFHLLLVSDTYTHTHRTSNLPGVFFFFAEPEQPIFIHSATATVFGSGEQDQRPVTGLEADNRASGQEVGEASETGSC